LAGLVPSASWAGAVSALERGRSQLKAGQSETAYETLYGEYLRSPQDADLAFWVGRAAFECGNFDGAVVAFEQFLSLRPGNARGQLELGRAYFRSKLYGLAEARFRQVLAKNPPDGVRRNIERYLQSIPRLAKQQQRHQLSGSLTLALTHDDNARISPDLIEVETLLGNLELIGPAATRTSDVFLSSTLTLGHRYRTDTPGRSWETALLAGNNHYLDEEDLEISYLSLGTGPSWSGRRLRVGLQATAFHLEKDHETYLNSIGLNVPIAVRPLSWLLLTAGLRGDLKDYLGDTQRNALAASLYLQPMILLGQNRLIPRLFLEHEKTDPDRESYNRVDVSLQLERQLTVSLLAYARARHVTTTYEERNANLFADKRRDRRQELKAGLICQFNEHLSSEVSYSHTTGTSSISLYEYDRDLVYAGLTLRF
jgi:tetratricopeptide (TPR) repeat protein